MIEKAFSAYFANGRNPINYRNITGSYKDTNSDDCAQKNAFKIILGNEAEFTYKPNKSDVNVETLFRKIKNALENKTPLHYGTCDNTLRDIDGDRVVAGHAFSLIGAEEKCGKYYIKLRNPWGRNYRKGFIRKDAIITVDLEEAAKVNFEIGNLESKRYMIYC